MKSDAFRTASSMVKPKSIGQVLKDMPEPPRRGCYIQELCLLVIDHIKIGHRREWPDAQKDIIERLNDLHGALHLAGRSMECATVEELISLARFCRSIEDVDTSDIAGTVEALRRRF